MERREKERVIINSETKKFLGEENFIQHPIILDSKSYLLRDDGVHLTDIGNDHLLKDF